MKRIAMSLVVVIMAIFVVSSVASAKTVRLPPGTVIVDSVNDTGDKSKNTATFRIHGVEVIYLEVYDHLKDVKIPVDVKTLKRDGGDYLITLTFLQGMNFKVAEPKGCWSQISGKDNIFLADTNGQLIIVPVDGGAEYSAIVITPNSVLKRIGIHE